MTSGQQQERYMHGHTQAAVQNQLTRSASSQGAFFLPYLRPRMSLLDCGCGSGGITLGLAAAVDPGLVTGLDMEENVIKQAIALARERGVSNVNFVVGNVYKIEFPDNSFD